MSSNEPRNLVEEAADQGITAITAHLAHADAKVETLLILLSAKDTPTGEPQQVTAGSNVEDARDLIALLGAHLVEAAAQVGIRIDLIPIQRYLDG